MSDKKKLIDYRHNIYSQFGEDGIIAKVFETIGYQSKVCVEFGAWDGYHLSNTANLWSKDPEWRSVLIEADESRYKTLCQNMKDRPNCIPIHAKVGITPDTCLDHILHQHKLDSKVDLLSIDIDGHDYHIFKSLKIRPRVIICEFNPTMPSNLILYPPQDQPDNYMGCSSGALIALAQSKEYKLVAMTEVNCIFVNRGADSDRVESVFNTDRADITLETDVKYLVTDFSGNYLVVGERSNHPYGLGDKLTKSICGDFKVSSAKVII